MPAKVAGRYNGDNNRHYQPSSPTGTHTHSVLVSQPAAGSQAASGAAQITGTGSIVAGGAKGATAPSATVTGTGAISSTGRKGAASSPVVTGSGSISSTGTAHDSGTAVIAGNGGINGPGEKGGAGTAGVSGNGGASASGVGSGGAAIAGPSLVTGGGATFTRTRPSPQSRYPTRPLQIARAGTASMIGRGTPSASGIRRFPRRRRDEDDLLDLGEL